MSGRDEDTKKLDYICAEELRQILDACNDRGQFEEFSKALGIGRLTRQMKVRLEMVCSSGQSLI